MSTPLACACVAALGSAFTLNPSTIALDAEASMTSLSVIMPTELWMTFSFTSSVERRSSDSANASTEPCTSALRMSRSSLTSPVWICFCKPSSVMRVAVLPLAFSRSSRIVAICRALRSSETATSTSPAAGTPERPVLDERGGYRSSPAVEPAFDDDALGGARRVGLELEDLGLQRRHLEQLVDA